MSKNKLLSASAMAMVLMISACELKIPKKDVPATGGAAVTKTDPKNLGLGAGATAKKEAAAEKAAAAAEKAAAAAEKAAAEKAAKAGGANQANAGSNKMATIDGDILPSNFLSDFYAELNTEVHRLLNKNIKKSVKGILLDLDDKGKNIAGTNVNRGSGHVTLSNQRYDFKLNETGPRINTADGSTSTSIKITITLNNKDEKSKTYNYKKSKNSWKRLAK